MNLLAIHALKKYAASLLFCVTTAGYAAPFSVTPQQALPTVVYSGTPTALYTVTNNSSITLNNNYVAYFPSLNGKVNSSQVLIDSDITNLCSAQFNLSPGGSCTLELLITGDIAPSTNPKYNLMICASDTTTCAGPTAANALNVTSYQQTAYIANTEMLGHPANYSLSICQVTSGTFSSCSLFQDPNDTFASPIDVILNASNTLAYIANRQTNNVGNYTLSICPVNAQGALQACTAYNTGGEFSDFDFDFTGLTLSADGTTLYSTAYDSSAVTTCALQSNGQVTSCYNFSDSISSGTLNNPQGRIAFNLAGTPAYIANNGDNSISVCPVSGNQLMAPCSAAFTDPSGPGFNIPSSLDINAAGTYLYVVNEGGSQTISICPISPSDGSLGDACMAFSNTNFNFGDITNNLFTHGPTPFAYIPNTVNHNIAICSFDTNSLDNCSFVSETKLLNRFAHFFQGPTSVWIANFPSSEL